MSTRVNQSQHIWKASQTTFLFSVCNLLISGYMFHTVNVHWTGINFTSISALSLLDYEPSSLFGTKCILNPSASTKSLIMETYSSCLSSCSPTHNKKFTFCKDSTSSTVLSSRNWVSLVSPTEAEIMNVQKSPLFIALSSILPIALELTYHKACFVTSTSTFALVHGGLESLHSLSLYLPPHVLPNTSLTHYKAIPEPWRVWKLSFNSHKGLHSVFVNDTVFRGIVLALHNFNISIIFWPTWLPEPWIWCGEFEQLYDSTGTRLNSSEISAPCAMIFQISYPRNHSFLLTLNCTIS